VAVLVARIRAAGGGDDRVRAGNRFYRGLDLLLALLALPILWLDLAGCATAPHPPPFSGVAAFNSASAMPKAVSDRHAVVAAVGCACLPWRRDHSGWLDLSLNPQEEPDPRHRPALLIGSGRVLGAADPLAA